MSDCSDGHGVSPEDRFCRQCGESTQPELMEPAPSPAAITGAAERSRLKIFLVGGASVAVVAATVGAIALGVLNPDSGVGAPDKTAARAPLSAPTAPVQSRTEAKAGGAELPPGWGEDYCGLRLGEIGSDGQQITQPAKDACKGEVPEDWEPDPTWNLDAGDDFTLGDGENMYQDLFSWLRADSAEPTGQPVSEYFRTVQDSYLVYMVEISCDMLESNDGDLAAASEFMRSETDGDLGAAQKVVTGAWKNFCLDAVPGAVED